MKAGHVDLIGLLLLSLLSFWLIRFRWDWLVYDVSPRNSEDDLILEGENLIDFRFMLF